MAQGQVVDIRVFGGVSGEFDSAHKGRFCGVTTAPWREDGLQPGNNRGGWFESVWKLSD